MLRQASDCSQQLCKARQHQQRRQTQCAHIFTHVLRCYVQNSASPARSHSVQPQCTQQQNRPSPQACNSSAASDNKETPALSNSLLPQTLASTQLQEFHSQPEAQQETSNSRQTLWHQQQQQQSTTNSRSSSIRTSSSTLRGSA